MLECEGVMTDLEGPPTGLYIKTEPRKERSRLVSFLPLGHNTYSLTILFTLLVCQNFIMSRSRK